ncbi:MAG: acyl-CoA desaturase [Myxococcales bacterium]|nr:acyl-CoA desaturase [Myxococcales bacterium]
MYLKTATIMGWWLSAWVAFLVLDVGYLGAVALAVVMGGGMAGIGMSVMHDGGHKAYADGRRLNALMSWGLDLMGGSAYIWNHKHNVQHHTYPNVVGSDDDVDLGPLARLAPESPRYALHRFQHLYMWPLYGLITIKWHWIDDFYQLARGRIGEHAFPRPKGTDAVVFWVGKLVFFSWALIIPILVKPVGLAVTFYLVAQMVQGVVLAITFQMAHCVEEAAYFEAPADGKPVTLDFARHQLATTIDFATTNRFATWYMGGLNFQAIHHLFPRICHVHYPALSAIVRETARDHGVPYSPTPSVRAALGSHYRWLKALGTTDEVVAPARAPAVPA